MQLPQDMHIENTCFFTGHRSLSAEHKNVVAPVLSDCLTQMIDDGIRYFCDGGALGFDLYCAQAVLQKQKEYPHIHLIMTLPCHNQTDKWLNLGQSGEESIRIYHRVKALASAVVYIQDLYTPDCMRERNQFMVDHSCRCITYWNGSVRGGTAQTVRMAKRAGLPIWNVYPGKQLNLTP